MNCRHCGKLLEHIFLDLGSAPPSNAYLNKEELSVPEKYFPLKIMVCDNCWLVQTEDYANREELFDNDYAYFSSTSQSWLEHAKEYSDRIIKRLRLNNESFVIEVASNDGYLLKNFVEAKIPCLGIEPTESTANAAEKIGVPVLCKFFGEELAKEVEKADLIIGNNVYAHVPEINDFTKGLKAALKPNGTITLEFPHFLKLLENNQFDTIYHEHFSYLSLYAVCRVFDAVGLKIYDVERLSTHGGSLRIYGCHKEASFEASHNVAMCLAQEIVFGLQKLETYKNFQNKTNKVRDDLLEFLNKQKKDGKKVAGFCAAAKGNTLLNYAGVKADLIDFICDSAPSKQGKFMPASHIPILPPSALAEHKPDYVLILAWNIADEIIEKQKQVFEWGGKFVAAVPEMKVLA